jgi:tetratricopeptide (TPR) repeat protein
MRGYRRTNRCLGALLLIAINAPALSAREVLDQARQLVVQIQRADYEGNREALLQLHDKLSKVTVPGSEARTSARALYWQGFALWRRAINGFNDNTDRPAIERDFEQAVARFEASIQQDPQFVDANVGLIACLQGLTFLNQGDAAKAQALVSRFVPLLKESVASAPENPRLLWVLGGSQWWAPPNLPQPQVIERQKTAMATYKKGLEVARAQKRPEDSLEPAWGEPELLMSLAWGSLNQATPDPNRAEAFAKQALERVPHWHYVRNILMPQIRRAIDHQRD